MNLFDRFLSWAYRTRFWGKRCPDYDPDCCVCQQWKTHDEIFNEER